MFPVSHIYVAKKVIGRVDDFLLAGCILPDVAGTSMGLIDRKKMHDSPDEFVNYVEKNFPQLNDLALGLCTHSGYSGGADHYSDDPKTGYAKVVGRKIAPKVSEYFGLDEIEATALAHNFIEMVLDHYLLEDYPELADIYRNFFIRVDWDLIGKCLAGYLEMDIVIINAELDRFRYYYKPEELMSNIGIEHIISVKFHAKYDETKTAILIKESKKIVEESYIEFFHETIKSVKVNLGYS